MHCRGDGAGGVRGRAGRIQKAGRPIGPYHRNIGRCPAGFFPCRAALCFLLFLRPDSFTIILQLAAFIEQIFSRFRFSSFFPSFYWLFCREWYNALISIRAKDENSRAPAFSFARRMARKQKSEVVIHDRDGAVRARHSYAGAQFPARD